MRGTTSRHTIPFSPSLLWFTGLLSVEKRLSSALGLGGPEVDPSIVTTGGGGWAERERERERGRLTLNKACEEWRQSLFLDLFFVSLQYNYYARIYAFHKLYSLDY